VHTCYTEGVPPEHLVLCAREATAHVLRESAHARQVIERVVGWAIQRYYRERKDPQSY